MDVLKNFLFLKLISKETLFEKLDSCMVNAYWVITWQAMQTLDYVNQGAVDGLLNECIRRYFFPSRAKEAKKQKEKIIITNNAWSQVRFVWGLIIVVSLACVASVSVRFRSKERGTRAKDRAKNGVSKRAGRGRVALVSFLARPKPRKRLLALRFATQAIVSRDPASTYNARENCSLEGLGTRGSTSIRCGTLRSREDIS